MYCKKESPPRHKHIDLVCIPGGEVIVENEEGADAVVDVEAFFISRQQVTYQQFEALGGIQQDCDPGHDREQGKWLNEAHKDQPARCMDLPGARGVAKTAGGKLPSEVQLRRAHQIGPPEMKIRRDEWLDEVPPGELGRRKREGQVPPDAARLRFYDDKEPMVDGFASTRRRSDTGFRVVMPLLD